jgi:hypothetical protein
MTVYGTARHLYNKAGLEIFMIDNCVAKHIQGTLNATQRLPTIGVLRNNLYTR